MPVSVLAVASELFPLVKTGGLADVTGALPVALAACDVATTTLIPGYPAVLSALREADTVLEDADLFGGPARILRAMSGGLVLLVLDAPHLFGRPRNPYVGPHGQDWPDNALRFAALGAMAARVARGGVAAFVPDVVHAHDWQAALALAYLKFLPGRQPGTVITVHNLAFQGLFPAEIFPTLGLPEAAFTVEGVEFHGMVGYLKAGLACADRITTVSPRYAEEIKTPEYGMGLEGLLQARGGVLHGILNGIDDAVWNPATDKMLAANFSASDASKRSANKATVQEQFGLARDPSALLFGVISRLTWQKGLDSLLEAIPDVLALGAQLVVLGTGEPALEAGFAAAAAAHPDRIGCVIGYDEALAHQMQAGIDALLVPSRFEPCGLTQLCALRYGAVPVVARVGGLADTVIDANAAAIAAGVATGVQFDTGGLRPALQRTAALWGQPKIWRVMQGNALKMDVSWTHQAAQYAALYRGVTAKVI
jgi:starch synthase